MPNPIHAPLSETACWKRPLASGDPTSPADMAEPADSPKIVTFRESPPKAAMFVRTHRSVAIASIRA
jgi:hypothetical protein